MLHVTGIPLIRENRLVYSLNRATETRPAHKMEGGVQLSNSIPNESLLFVARILRSFEFLLCFTAKVAKSDIVQKLIQDKRNNHHENQFSLYLKQLHQFKHLTQKNVNQKFQTRKSVSKFWYSLFVENFQYRILRY
jgi:hypothetical protein